MVYSVLIELLFVDCINDSIYKSTENICKFGKCNEDTYAMDSSVIKQTIEGTIGESLLAALHRNGIPLAANCGGIGRCGACGVRVIWEDENMKHVVSEDEQIVFDVEELAAGYRLACGFLLKGNMRILLPKTALSIEEGILLSNGLNVETKADIRIDNRLHIETGKHLEKKDNIEKVEEVCIEMDIKEDQGTLLGYGNARNMYESKGFGIAIDIGTTTLGFSLVDLNTGKQIRESGRMNAQRIHGADVSARIEYASNEEGLSLLRDMIQNSLMEGMELLLGSGDHISFGDIKSIAIAANTTMLHILQGMSPRSLGAFPFTPVDVSGGTFTFKEILGERGGCECNALVYILPSSSAYIGADLTVGAAYLGMGQGEQIDLLLDLGTNGEMILGNKHKLLSTSTAAGPAFESSFKVQGVHGSRLIDLIANSIRRGKIDKTGLIASRYFEKGIPCEGGIIIDQKTVREIQLAKGAICAGIELLVQEYGIIYQEISNVYIAGGFGFYLPIQNAIFIGLLPKAVKNKLKIVGNTSLLGAMEYLTKSRVREETKVIANFISNIDLANHPDFNTVFLTKVNF